MKIKITLLKIDQKVNHPIVRLTNNNPTIYSIYYYTILQLRKMLFLLCGGWNRIATANLTLKDKLNSACRLFGNKYDVLKYKSDLLASYILYGIDPEEYFLYDFPSLKHDERRCFLSDRERKFGCKKILNWNTYYELKEKDVFYKLTSQYFNREVCIVKKETDFKNFQEFIRKQPRFFAKPNNGTFGLEAEIINISDFDEEKDLFQYFISKNNTWVLEEIINQDPEMAVWNNSCVNTVRMTSFIRTDGKHVVLQPFIRTGRNGAIVDNAGAGGIFAVFDPETGIVITDGVDESGNRFKKHPNSDIVYRGWQIPYYKELKSLTEIVHRSLPKYHKYVGFDFALSTKGWLLVEGNWGQFLGQIAEQKGVRYQFEQLMGLPEDTCFE